MRKSTLEDGLRILAEATELAKSIRIDLTDDYLRLIAQVEAMPRNQNGADKSYVWRAEQAFRATFKNARLIERQP
jgi:hypothetical protein